MQALREDSRAAADYHVRCWSRPGVRRILEERAPYRTGQDTVPASELPTWHGGTDDGRRRQCATPSTGRWKRREVLVFDTNVLIDASQRRLGIPRTLQAHPRRGPPGPVASLHHLEHLLRVPAGHHSPARPPAALARAGQLDVHPDAAGFARILEAPSPLRTGIRRSFHQTISETAGHTRQPRTRPSHRVADARARDQPDGLCTRDTDFYRLPVPRRGADPLRQPSHSPCASSTLPTYT